MFIPGILTLLPAFRRDPISSVESKPTRCCLTKEQVNNYSSPTEAYITGIGVRRLSKDIAPPFEKKVQMRALVLVLFETKKEI